MPVEEIYLIDNANILMFFYFPRTLTHHFENFSTFSVWYSLLFASGTQVLLICEILYIFSKINYEKMR